MGLDPGSGKNLLRILDPGVKKAPNPATLEPFIVYCTVEETNWPELLQVSVRLQPLQQYS